MLTSCTTDILTPSDELVSSSWYAKLENNNEIKLSFLEDTASLILTFPDNKKIVIHGFCEVSDTAFVIHDEKTDTPFAFEYIVHFDRVEVIYNKNTVSLYKL